MSVYIDDGRVEIDNNIAERACVRLESEEKIGLFAGSDKGGELMTLAESYAAGKAYAAYGVSASRGHPMAMGRRTSLA